MYKLFFYPVFNYYYNNHDDIYVGPLKTETRAEEFYVNFIC